jgi:signal transduction histidine kinase
MKKYRRNVALVLFSFLLICIGVNLYLYNDYRNKDRDNFYKVEENRILDKLNNDWDYLQNEEDKLLNNGGKYPNAVAFIDLTSYSYIIDVQILELSTTESNADAMETFFNTKNVSVDYKTIQIGNQVKIVKFQYKADPSSEYKKLLFVINAIFIIIFMLLLIILVYLGRNIIRPFYTLRDLPIELSKGTLTKAIPESKNKFFGKFTWGLDLLRQKLETQRAKELQLEKEKKMLILSISHDIKTPLSAIKLYVKALKENLYDTEAKRQEVLANIQRNSEEIEQFLGEIIKTSTTDFLKIEVNSKEEYYLKELMDNLEDYYHETMNLKLIHFAVSIYDNCLLKGDKNRTIEVLQNVIENAMKYGDGKEILIEFDDEESCKLITVANSGNTLPETELVHIFESFYRGSNVTDKKGNGLGLYICKEIMNQMNGEIFAQMKDGWMRITLVIMM